MQPRLLKYLLDIDSIIEEVENIKVRVGNDFITFKSDFILQRAIERDLEIIGEAVRNIRDQFPLIKITSSSKIIGLRNLITHAYDSIEPEMIWGIIQKDIPLLKIEVEQIKKSA
jgi:uncharacterized protein with HEPN domain